MKVGLLGGTFDPVHNGHLKLAKAALRQRNLSCVYLVLSPRSPFKIKEKLSPVLLRKKWLGLSLKSQHRLHMGTWELNRPGPSYTVQTLACIKKQHPKWELVLIMGSDAYRTLPRWKNPSRILRLAEVLVGRRPGASSVRIPPSLKNRVGVLKGVFPKISSTDIRTLGAGSSRRLRSFLPAPVLRAWTAAQS